MNEETQNKELDVISDLTPLSSDSITLEEAPSLDTEPETETPPSTENPAEELSEVVVPEDSISDEAEEDGPVTSMTSQVDLTTRKTSVKNASENRTVRRMDEHVKKKLKYDTIFDLFDAFSTEQINTLATAIDQIDKESQTTIIANLIDSGNSAVVAGIMRYAKILGRRPVVITQKTEHFSAVYQGLIDIGSFHGIIQKKLAEVRVEDNNYSDKDIYARIEEDIDNGDFMLDYDTSKLFKKGYSQTYECIEKYRELYFSSDTVSIPVYIENSHYAELINTNLNFTPFILNKAEIKNAHGDILFPILALRFRQDIINDKHLPAEFACILLTHHQLKEQSRFEFVKKMSHNTVVIMDKSGEALEQEPKLYSENKYKKVSEQNEVKDLLLKMTELHEIILETKKKKELQAKANIGTIDPTLAEADRKKIRFFLKKYASKEISYKELKTLTEHVMNIKEKLYFSDEGNTLMKMIGKKYKSGNMQQYDYASVADLIILEFGKIFYKEENS